MASTIIATEIGTQGDGCAVVAFLSENAQAQIANLLRELKQELGDTIWTPPLKALHSTLCEIIQQIPYEEDKDVIYKRHHAEYEAALQEVLACFGPIRIAFDRIEVSPNAIIIRGDDTGTFNQIRALLTEKLPFPPGTRRPPDIIHSSIARFLKEEDLDMVEQVVARHSINFEEIVTEFLLLYPVSPYVLDYQVVRRYPLQG